MNQPITERSWPGLDVSGAKILVTGFGVSGYAVADQTMQRGAHVTVVDAATDAETEEKAQILRVLGVDVRLGREHTLALPTDKEFDLVVTSPGWRPDQPLLAEAAARGIEIWSEIELARRMQPIDGPAWLAVTGTNGKTTVVTMAADILRAAGFKAVAAGNVGLPLIEAALSPERLDVIALELSSFQLHWTEHLFCEASCILNISEDHVDWHGGMSEYAAAKAKIFAGTKTAIIYNTNDPLTLQAAEEADVAEGARAIGLTLGSPGPSELGVVEELLVDRAFIPNRHTHAAELCTLADLAHLGDGRAPTHVVFDALAAAALTRAFGVPPIAVQQALRQYGLGSHRLQVISSDDELTWIDDSKATNPHAAQASILSCVKPDQKAVWVVGGLAKGAHLGELFKSVSSRLRAVIIIGEDTTEVDAATSELDSAIPIVRIAPNQGERSSENAERIMADVVAAAKEKAVPGDLVLLAPACASMDQFVSYAQRGDFFAEAVKKFS